MKESGIGGEVSKYGIQEFLKSNTCAWAAELVCSSGESRANLIPSLLTSGACSAVSKHHDPGLEALISWRYFRCAARNWHETAFKKPALVRSLL
jgi:hypothetical protein